MASTVSISEAARLTKKNRKTIQRAVADGRLSMSQDVAGKPRIDISELIRVFGEFQGHNETRGTDLISQHGNQNGTSTPPNVAVMQAEIDGLKAIIEAKNETIDGLRQAMRLLESPAKRSWWKSWS